MNKPIPPSQWKSTDLDVREDLRRLRVYLTQLEEWIATSSGGRSGTISGVTAGTGLTDGGTSGNVTLAADFGTTSGKVTQGNDSRLSDDRTASGVRTATTVVSVSGATAPTSGQVLTATSGTAATWQTPSAAPVTSVFSRTGAVVAQSGDYTASQVGLGNVTNDAQLKRSANDFSTFTAKSSLAGSDLLLIEDSAASGAKKKITASSLVVSGSAFDPSVLAPLHWWKASNNSQTGGLVDSVTDTGSSPKNFTATGANRAATGTDANGLTYLALSGSLYQAGAAADWAFMSNGSPWTMMVVINKTAFTSGVFEAFLATMTYSSSGHGLRFSLVANTNLPGPTPIAGWEMSIHNGGGIIVSPYLRNPAPTGVQVACWQYSGYGVASQTSEFTSITGTSVMRALRLNLNGEYVTATGDSNAARATTPDTALTLGAFGSGSGFTKATVRFYELMLLNRTVSDQQVQQYAAYAAATYGITI
jgi:hypothetical protein